MQGHILNSLFQAALVLVGVLVLVFFMVRATGDPATLMLAREASPAQVAAFREKMGFHRPVPVQFLDFVAQDLGGGVGVVVPGGFECGWGEGKRNWARGLNGWSESPQAVG